MIRRLWELALGAVILSSATSAALADAYVARKAAVYSDRAGYSLACENGRNYAIRPIAVTIEGDLVTGYLLTGHGRSVHIRLIPMGDGYRYAGRGIWFDGLRGDAVLNWGTPRAVSCSITS